MMEARLWFTRTTDSFNICLVLFVEEVLFFVVYCYIAFKLLCCFFWSIQHIKTNIKQTLKQTTIYLLIFWWFLFSRSFFQFCLTCDWFRTLTVLYIFLYLYLLETILNFNKLFNTNVQKPQQKKNPKEN